MTVLDEVTNLIKPSLDEQGIGIYEITYQKEGKDLVLRILVEKTDETNISLDEIVYENSKDGSQVCLIDTIADDKYEVSEQLYELTGCHTFDEFISNIKQLNILSKFEMEALHLYLLGYSQAEIGEILNKKQSTAGRAYQRALNKIRKYYHII